MECLYYVLQNANPNVPSLIYVMFIHDKENALNFYVPTRLHKTPKCTMRIHRANRWCIIANSDVARAIISFFFFFFDFLRILAGGPVPCVIPCSSATSSAVLLFPQKDYMLKKSLSLWSKFLVAIMQQQQQQVKALHTLYQLHKQESACNECASNEWSSNFRSNTEKGMSCENAAMPLECKRMCLHIVSLFMWWIYIHNTIFRRIFFSGGHRIAQSF